MTLLEKVIAVAKQKIQTIVLPETNDPRTIEATERIIGQGIAKVVLIGNKDEICTNNPDKKIDEAIFIDPSKFEHSESYANDLYNLRKEKGMSLQEAKRLITENPLYLGCMLVKKGFAGGMVAGAANSTANVLRPALQIIKTAPNTKLVSTVFIMEVPNCEYGENGVFVFGDCALNPSPSSEELAHIAISSAKTFDQIVKAEPKVSILSFSSKGSAKHEDVNKVIEATKIANKLAPDLMLDGELQLDAAIIPSVGAKKAPDSKVSGQSNVIIFPDLNSGNIGYKLVQRLAKAEAYGPLCQGLAMPVNDLSRGCSSDDIVGTVALTALQAQMSRG